MPCKPHFTFGFPLWDFTSLIFFRMMINVSYVVRIAAMSITQTAQSPGLFYWFQKVLLSETWYQLCQALWQSHLGSILTTFHAFKLPFVSG